MYHKNLSSICYPILSQINAYCWEQWWEHWPSTNVLWVRFPDGTSYVGWVCWFSTLLREVFSQLLPFCPLTKNQHLFWFDLCLFDFLSPQLVEPLFLLKYTWDINKVIIINIIIISSIIIIVITKSIWWSEFSDVIAIVVECSDQWTIFS